LPLAARGRSEGGLFAPALTGCGEPLTDDRPLAGSAVPGPEVGRPRAHRLIPTLPVLVRTLMRLLRIDVGKRSHTTEVLISPRRIEWRSVS